MDRREQLETLRQRAHVPAATPIQDPDRLRLEELRAAATPPVEPETTPAQAFVGGVARGARQTTPLVTGLVGMKMGAPLGPYGMAAGLGAGLVGGEGLMRLFENFANVPQPEDMPDDLLWAYYGGEVMGSGGPMVPAVTTAARMGARAVDAGVGRYINRILDTAARSPVSFMTAETSALSSAALGEAVAEAAYPGRPEIRIPAGVAAGAANPSMIAVNAADFGIRHVKRVASAFSASGAESRAAAEIQRIVREFGEDPIQIARALRESDITGAKRTAAQLTGSPALAAMERQLVNRSAKFGLEAQRRAEESLATLRASIGVLEETGDPGALRQAARLRSKYFESLMQWRVADAESDAIQAAARISPDIEDAPTIISKRIYELVADALREARVIERYLWSRVSREAPVQADNIISTANRIRADDMLPEEEMPPLVRRFVARMARQGGKTNVREAQIFRSKMLEAARHKDNTPAQARFYGQMAEAALDDLSASAGPEFEDARAFSKALNDVFTRTFAGQAMSTDYRGAHRIPPEVMMPRALGTGGEMATLRMKELERAIRFSSPEAADEMFRLQEAVLMRSAQSLVDESGVINPRRLSTFLRRNAEVLSNFPELREMLGNADQAARFLGNVRSQADRASRAIERKTILSQIMNGENPVREVGRIMEGDSPQRGLRQLVSLARRADNPEEAMAGLRSAFLEDVFVRAGGNSERFNFTTYNRLMMEPRHAGQPSAFTMAVREGVIDSQTAARLKRLLGEAEKVESVMRSAPNLDQLLEAESAIYDFAHRWSGARLGAASSRSTQGAVLQVSAAASRLMRHVMQRVPRGRAIDVLIEAAENPQLMATLLEKPSSQREKILLARRLNAYLWQAGLVRGPGEAIDEDESIEQSP